MRRKLPEQAPKYLSCSYLKYTGELCGKRCIGSLCAEHSRCTIHVACRLCGRGTHSIYGFCATPGPCRTAQQLAARNASLEVKRQTPQPRAEPVKYIKSSKYVTPGAALLDKFADELFAELVAVE